MLPSLTDILVLNIAVLYSYPSPYYLYLHLHTCRHFIAISSLFTICLSYQISFISEGFTLDCPELLPQSVYGGTIIWHSLAHNKTPTRSVYGGTVIRRSLAHNETPTRPVYGGTVIWRLLAHNQLLSCLCGSPVLWQSCVILSQGCSSP